ncbi:zinc-binding dehydrogenase, partial [Pantoea sp. SIMBA_133]
MHAVRQSSLKAGDSAAVFGAGPIGLMNIEALKAAGAAQIYAVEVAPSRKAKAEALGAIVVDPQQEDAVAKLQMLSNGGVDVAFE